MIYDEANLYCVRCEKITRHGINGYYIARCPVCRQRRPAELTNNDKRKAKHERRKTD